MQSGTASSDATIDPGILDRIAYVFIRVIGTACVVERFRGDHGTTVWEKQEQVSRQQDVVARRVTSSLF